MRKFFKIIALSAGILMILFGIFGGVTELTAENPETSGLILAPLFFVLGIIFIYLGLRKKRIVIRRHIKSEKIQEEPESLSENKHQNQVPWQRTFLIVSGSAEIIFLILAIVFATIYGIAGIVGGEMGAIIGFLMFAAAIFFAAIISVRVMALWGIIKKKRWAPSLNMILMIAMAIISLFSMLWPMVIYWSFAGWCSYFLVKHPLLELANVPID